MSYYQAPGQGQPGGYPQQHFSPPPQQGQYGQPPPQQQYGHPGQQQQQYPPQHGHPQQYAPPAQPHPAPPQHGAPQPQSASVESGNFQGGSYTISHRHTNSILTLRLTDPSALIKSKTGVMIHMGPQIVLKGEIKFSMKKMFTGGEMKESSYQGSGPLTLGPTLFGDITTIHIGEGPGEWFIGKDAYLASTKDVVKDTKSQGIGKALFSGEDLFVYKVNGRGLLWVSSYGAIDRIDLGAGEEHIVDNGHLVAWSCQYKVEKVGGSMNALKSGEGLVCRFKGPGSVFVQTRNLEEFSEWVRAVAGTSSS